MKRIPAPIDNKNLMEDPFEDGVFQDFLWAPEHRNERHRRHMVGLAKTENYDAIVDARWWYGGHSVEIRLLALQPAEDVETVRDEVFAHYEKTFKSWQCEDNEGLVVETKVSDGVLTVSFYFEYE